LPQLRGHAGKAKSYAERLFDYPELGPLNAIDARRAIVLPALAEDILIEEPALFRCSTGSWCEPCRSATGGTPEIPLSYAPRCN